MDIQSLLGFTLEACRFSRSSCAFEFSGLLGDRHVTLIVSTSSSVSVAGGPRVDLLEDFSRGVWPLLERQITRIETDAQAFEARFEFGAGRGFTVWADGPPIDNLLLVRDRDNGAWFPVL